ncbi:hypothetical protein MTO96_028446 [Rhipicephalus appendiculatus]
MQLGSLLTDTVQPRLRQTGFTGISSFLKAFLPAWCPTLPRPAVSSSKWCPDIPRLYRRTNREVPSKPSSYVQQILSPLATLKDLGSQNASLNWDPEWTASVLEEVTKQ